MTKQVLHLLLNMFRRDSNTHIICVDGKEYNNGGQEKIMSRFLEYHTRMVKILKYWHKRKVHYTFKDKKKAYDMTNW